MRKRRKSKGEMLMTVIRDRENTLIMDITHGRVIIEMRPDLAPNHVARIKELARSGFYDGIVFHRVIDGFDGPRLKPRQRRQPVFHLLRRCLFPRWAIYRVGACH